MEDVGRVRSESSVVVDYGESPPSPAFAGAGSSLPPSRGKGFCPSPSPSHQGEGTKRAILGEAGGGEAVEGDVGFGGGDEVGGGFADGGG